MLTVDKKVYQETELLIWQNFALKNKKRLKPLRTKTAQQGNMQAPLELFNFQDQNYACNLYATFNNSDKYSVHDTYKIITIQGYDLVAGTCSKNEAEMLINPKDVDILLFKMNPLSESFKLSHQVVAEEVLNKVFARDTRSVALLSSIGAIQPTASNLHPEIKSRETKQNELVVFNKTHQKSEINRLKVIDNHKKSVHINLETQRKFRANQKSLLEEFAQTNDTSKKYFYPKSHVKSNEVDPFFVLSESFKDVLIENEGHAPLKGGLLKSDGHSSVNQMDQEKTPVQTNYHIYGNPNQGQEQKGCEIF